MNDKKIDTMHKNEKEIKDIYYDVATDGEIQKLIWEETKDINIATEMYKREKAEKLNDKINSNN